MTLDLDALTNALVGLPPFAGLRRDELAPMAGGAADRGLAHTHVRIGGRGAVARVPLLSQQALAPQENLDYQRACFARAEPSGHTPRLLATIAPRDGMPFGALVVSFVDGRPPRLPDDMAAIAVALAGLHALPLPPAPARPPLLDSPDAVAAMVATIEAQAAFLDDAGIATPARAQIDAERAWARDFAAVPHAGPIALIASDAHPGNFLIEATGKAVLVDLEKAQYGSPAIDLAHASLASSTVWDMLSGAVLTADAVGAFHRGYFDAAPAGTAAALAPLLLPMRRLTWLRTTTFMARWRVLSRTDSPWSAQHLPPALRRHAEARVDDILSADFIAAVRREWLGPRPLVLP